MHFDSVSVIEESYDYKIKIMLIGDTNVGKTSIIKRYCKNQFSPSFITSVGVDFESKYFKIGDKMINLQLWDTAGQERYKVLAKNYFNKSDGFIIVYDITDTKTFYNVTDWIKQINESAPGNVKSVLLGNKSDLKDMRQVNKEEGKELAKKFNLQFYETSAASGYNIENVFVDLVKIFLKDYNFLNQRSRASSQYTECSKISANRNQKKKCC